MCVVVHIWIFISFTLIFYAPNQIMNDHQKFDISRHISHWFVFFGLCLFWILEYILENILFPLSNGMYNCIVAVLIFNINYFWPVLKGRPNSWLCANKMYHLSRPSSFFFFLWTTWCDAGGICKQWISLSYTLGYKIKLTEQCFQGCLHRFLKQTVAPYLPQAGLWKYGIW